ncbi:hypothetical protein BaRGS_00005869 [Batillaria attramentaria]|uniref:sphinganine-1-phosphate aldolase n=1 Tax=Batillaria attramentaria TaxID=370345 RepID=A0ABD0LUL0_9CAEN
MLLLLLEHLLLAAFIAALVGVYLSKGRDELLRVLVVGVKSIPGMAGVVNMVLKSEASNFIKQTPIGGGSGKPPQVTIPEKGMSSDELRQKLREFKEKELDHEKGQIFAYTYTLSDDHYNLQKDVFDMFTEKFGASEDQEKIVREFHLAFLHENALNPMIYPCLRQMETEVISMTAAMLNGDEDTVGFLTSGGTESILMAVKTYRDRAHKLFPHIKHPEIVAPRTQHPVMAKAAHYFGLTIKHVPVGPDYRADVKELEKAIGPNTVLLGCSAPQFCHGIVDPVEEIGALGLKYGLPVHVDACFGGFMLPWIEKLGYPVPKWDFRCAGVTSISADVHKYGYCAKGASAIVYRNSELRKYQIFTYAEWPGGLYGSPSMAGTRPAWASLKALGEDGFMAKARELMDITDTLKAGVQKIDGLTIIGTPHMTCFAVGSNDPEVNILAVADVMETKGWKIERQQKPDCMHCSILPHHKHSSSKLLDDLAASVKEVRANKSLNKKGTAGMYGMMATIPDKAIVSDFITEFFSEVYTLK